MRFAAGHGVILPGLHGEIANTFPYSLVGRRASSLRETIRVGYPCPSCIRNCRYNSAMLRFTVIFLILLVGLFTLGLLPPVERHVVVPFTAGLAKVCTALVSVFDTDVLTYGKIIQSASNGFAIEIERGCNGIEAMIVLAAAVLAFPAPLWHKLIGLAVGFVAIQGLNILRIISLFYLGQWSLTAFEWFHLYIWQALIILDALVVWLIWLKYLPRASHGAAQRQAVA